MFPGKSTVDSTASPAKLRLHPGAMAGRAFHAWLVPEPIAEPIGLDGGLSLTG